MLIDFTMKSRFITRFTSLFLSKPWKITFWRVFVSRTDYVSWKHVLGQLWSVSVPYQDPQFLLDLKTAQSNEKSKDKNNWFLQDYFNNEYSQILLLKVVEKLQNQLVDYFNYCSGDLDIITLPNRNIFLSDWAVLRNSVQS